MRLTLKYGWYTQAAVSATSQMQAAAEALLAAGLLDKLIMLALKGSDPSAQSVRNQVSSFQLMFTRSYQQHSHINFPSMGANSCAMLSLVKPLGVFVLHAPFSLL